MKRYLISCELSTSVIVIKDISEARNWRVRMILIQTGFIVKNWQKKAAESVKSPANCQISYQIYIFY